MSKQVAVILCGCGVYDGSEVHESSAVFVHLSRDGAQYVAFAPNIDQMHVVDHVKGQPSEEKRNVLTESARIARGNVKDLKDLKVSEFDAIIIPGGFGVAKNLSTWATQGKDCSVIKPIEDAIRGFHAAKKPIGLCCISPVLAAKILPGCEVTVGSDKECDKLASGRPDTWCLVEDTGAILCKEEMAENNRLKHDASIYYAWWPYAGTAGAIEQLGCKHVNKQVNEVHIDAKNKLVTTCAFMSNSPLHEIFDGIGEMVKAVLKRS